MSNAPWPDEMTQELRDLWKRGDSASVIAKKIDTTRNAVLGKAHRLGLEPRKVANIIRGRYEKRVRTPKTLPHVSSVTGQTILTKSHAVKAPPKELTKLDLRRMLQQAVVNTGGVLA